MATVPFPEVKDRNVATPSRVRLTKAVGIEDDNIFDVEAVPGTVYEEGTPLNKEFFDKLKLYMDNNVGSPDNPVPITNGGTGANTPEGARSNLGVYSTTEVDEIVERAGAKIDPHINSKITDAPEGVHGIYIDDERRIWTDPDGDGSFTNEVHAVDNHTITYEGDSPTLVTHLGALMKNASYQIETDYEVSQITVKNTYPDTFNDEPMVTESNTLDYLDLVVKLNGKYYILLNCLMTNSYKLVYAILEINEQLVSNIWFVDANYQLASVSPRVNTPRADYRMAKTSNDKLVISSTTYYKIGSFPNIASQVTIVDPATKQALYYGHPTSGVSINAINLVGSCSNCLVRYNQTWMSSAWRTYERTYGDPNACYKVNLTEQGVKSNQLCESISSFGRVTRSADLNKEYYNLGRTSYTKVINTTNLCGSLYTADEPFWDESVEPPSSNVYTGSRNSYGRATYGPDSYSKVYWNFDFDTLSMTKTSVPAQSIVYPVCNGTPSSVNITEITTGLFCDDVVRHNSRYAHTTNDFCYGVDSDVGVVVKNPYPTTTERTRYLTVCKNNYYPIKLLIDDYVLVIDNSSTNMNYTGLKITKVRIKNESILSV